MYFYDFEYGISDFNDLAYIKFTAVFDSGSWNILLKDVQKYLNRRSGFFNFSMNAE